MPGVSSLLRLFAKPLLYTKLGMVSSSDFELVARLHRSLLVINHLLLHSEDFL